MLKALGHRSVILVLFVVSFAHNANAQLVPGVLQSAAQTGTVTGTVAQSDGTPVVGADVRLSGTALLVTKSDAHGTFAFTSVPYGVYRIDAVTANLGTASRDITVKGDITVAIQYIAQGSSGGLKTIARVSTRSAGASINVTPASIASVNPSEYAFQGNTSWRQLLNQIPGVTVGGDLGGGGNDYNAIPNGPFQPIILSINGALPYETSTTLDGMPLINTSVTTTPGCGTNLSYLPMTSFDTADVVRGPGTNAPSIVDSVGGSFVLHAPGKVDKNEFEFSASNDPYGGIVSNAKVALRLGRLSAAFTYGLYNSPGPLGIQNVIPGENSFPLMINGQPLEPCATCDPVASPYQGNFEQQTPLVYCCVQVNTAWRQHNGALSLSYDITPSITAQVFYAGSSSKMQLGDYNLPLLFAPDPSYAGSITPGFHIYNQGVQEPISQASSLLEEKLTAYAGRGILRLAALQSNSFTVQNIQGVYPASGQYSLWGTGYYSNAPSTPVNFNGTSANLTFPVIMFDENYWVNNRDLLASYAMQIGSASHIGISYVTSYYNEPGQTHITFGPFNIFSNTATTAVAARTNEFRLNAGTELSDKLSLDASWYIARGSYHVPNPNDPTGNTYEDSIFPYSAPRLGAVWHANPDIVIRASVGGGYALPPLSYLIGSNGAPSCSGGICSITLTNLNLVPEKSFGFDVGTDMRLHHDTVLSLDLYRTNLYGQFFQSTNLTGTFTGLPLYTTQYNNLSQSRFEGVNIDVRHDVAKGIYWHGALGLTRGYVVSVPAGFYDDPTAPCTNCRNTYIVPGINFDGQFQSTVPYANGDVQIGYRWAPEKYIDLSPTYYGNGNPYFEPAFIEVDAHVGYALTKNVSLLATFRNITGIYGQNIESTIPTLGAETIAASGQLPFALFGLPYGPRTVVVTALFKY